MGMLLTFILSGHVNLWYLAFTVMISLYLISRLNWPPLMPQSHCPESDPERASIDHSSWFEWSFLVIRGHSSNDNDNYNPFEQRSSCACSQYKVFGHVQKVRVASWNKFHSRWYACRTCSYRVCRTTYMLYSSRFALYTMSFVQVHFTRTECECDSIEKKRTE